MNDPFKDRKLIIRLLFLGLALMLALRAFYLQVWEDTYAKKAEATAVSKLTLYPSRGLIFDRKGELLINNTPVYDLMVTYNQMSPDMDTTEFCRLLGISKESFQERLHKDFKNDIRFSKIKPFVFLSKIPAETYATFQESLYEFPGFFVQVRNIRSYPYKNAGHVLGFIKEVDDKDITTSGGQYVLGDYVGASGLEKTYEKELRGQKGVSYILKDNLGRDLGEFEDGKKDVPAMSGKDLTASIDIELQAYAEKLMQHKIGAIVAIEPKSGEVLTLVSSPNYDPNKMSISRNRGPAYLALANDSLKPLFNRAVMAEYSPGSTFKPVVALLGLEEGVIQPNQSFFCPGYYSYNTYQWGCHSHPQATNVTKAIQYSCNTYFFHTFRAIVDKYGFFKPQQGLDTLVSYLYDFGLGKPLGIDFPGEKNGNVPTSNFYNKLYPPKKGGWKSPTILSLGIGQGEMQLTSLQMANVAAIIANRGFFFAPHLVKGIRGEETPLIFSKFKKRKVVGIDSLYFEPVIKGMKKVVSAGTGWAAYIPNADIAGKTGTVQNPHGKDHSTFIAFAPANNPQIALAVYVENAGGGGRFAAPIASLIIEKYLYGKVRAALKYRENQMLNANLIDTTP